MLIQKILMPPEVAEKIKYKHGLDPIVAKNVLEDFSANYIEKVGGGNYMAIVPCSAGYVTVFLNMKLELLRLKPHISRQIGRLIFTKEREDDYEG